MNNFYAIHYSDLDCICDRHFFSLSQKADFHALFVDRGMILAIPYHVFTAYALDLPDAFVEDFLLFSTHFFPRRSEVDDV